MREAFHSQTSLGSVPILVHFLQTFCLTLELREHNTAVFFDGYETEFRKMRNVCGREVMSKTPV